jgi:hypothetical protein
MMSKANLEFMESAIGVTSSGASKGTLKRFEQQLLGEDWRTIREGLEVKMCPSPDGGRETYILCRSRDRREKEKAMHERFEHRIDAGLEKVRASCEKRKWKKEAIDRRVGQIMAKNSRAAVYEVAVEEVDGRTVVSWRKNEACASGRAQRGLLPSPHECHGLVGRGSLASVHPVDRCRGSVPNPQERPANSSGLAPDRGAGASPYPGLFLGIRPLEDAASDDPGRRAGRRTASDI